MVSWRHGVVSTMSKVLAFGGFHLWRGIVWTLHLLYTYTGAAATP